MKEGEERKYRFRMAVLVDRTNEMNTKNEKELQMPVMLGPDAPPLPPADFFMDPAAIIMEDEGKGDWN